MGEISSWVLLHNFMTTENDNVLCTFKARKKWVFESFLLQRNDKCCKDTHAYPDLN